MASDKTRRVSFVQLLHNRNFLALWLGQMVSFLGDYFYFLALPIAVNRLTGSTLSVGLSTIANALPMLLFGPVAGVFVDRWDRRRTMIAADILRAGLVLLCLTVRSPELVWVFYLTGFLMSTVSRFFFPAQNAVIPLIVREEELLTANGISQINQTIAMLAGPALAGFLIGLWGEGVAFIADSVSFVLSAVAIFTMRVPRTTPGSHDANLRAVWGELWEGVTYLFNNATMVGVLICLAVVQLGAGAINVLWVPFLARYYHLGPEGMGVVDSVQGVGMVIGGLAIGFLTARLGKIWLTGVSLAIIGVCIVLMGVAPTFAFILISSFVLGMALVPAQAVLMTLMQLAVPDLKRGRVSGALNALTMAAGLVSMVAAAMLGEVLSLRVIYVGSGLLVALSGVVGVLVIKEPTGEAETAAALTVVPVTGSE